MHNHILAAGNVKLLRILSPKGGGKDALLSEDEPDILKHMNASFPLPAQGEPTCGVLLRLPVSLTAVTQDQECSRPLFFHHSVCFGQDFRKQKLEMVSLKVALMENWANSCL